MAWQHSLVGNKCKSIRFRCIQKRGMGTGHCGSSLLACVGITWHFLSPKSPSDLPVSIAHERGACARRLFPVKKIPWKNHQSCSFERFLDSPSHPTEGREIGIPQLADGTETMMTASRKDPLLPRNHHPDLL